MVLLNYEKFIQERLKEQAQKFEDSRIVKICQDTDFHTLMVKLYEYCEQINIIEQRMDILAKQTQKMKNLSPKLLDSEIIKIEEKTKQISSQYSIFLFKQQKIKVATEQKEFYEKIIKLIIHILEKCFNKEDFDRLKKQINRLIRTNTFNKKICWNQFMDNKTKMNPKMSEKKKKMLQFNFRGFRRSIISESSEIRPYVNNRSCFKSSSTRSPMISLLFPTSQYRSFKLSRRNMKSFRK